MNPVTTFLDKTPVIGPGWERERAVRQARMLDVAEWLVDNRAVERTHADARSLVANGDARLSAQLATSALVRRRQIDFLKAQAMSAVVDGTPDDYARGIEALAYVNQYHPN